MLDTGAGIILIVGYKQAQAYAREFNTILDRSTAGEVRAYFGIGNASLVGKIEVISLVSDITFYVMESNTPFLLCL